MEKINFTIDHEMELKGLFTELGFKGEVLAGKFGANTYTVFDCLHSLSISTLKQMNSLLKKEIAALEDVDEWTSNKKNSAKASNTKKWQKFVSLTIGYKLNEEWKAQEDAKQRKHWADKLAKLKGIAEQAEIDQLKQLSADDLKAEIQRIESDLFA